jgi:hypothetical protein
MGSDRLSRRELLRLAALSAGATVVAGRAESRTLSSEPARSSSEHTLLGKNRLGDFIALSEELTGVKPLDSHLAAQYMDRYVSNAIVGPYLQDLLDAYKSITLLSPSDQADAIQSRILDPAALLRPAAEQLVYLWYTSAFAIRDQSNPNKIIWQYGDEHQYNNALIWKVNHGHPPMTTASEWVEAPEHSASSYH